MADIQSAYLKSVDAFNEVAAVASKPTITDLGTQITTLQGANATLQSQLDTANASVTQLSADKTSLQSQLTAASASVTQLTADKAAMQSAINAAVAKAQADKDADNANVAGQGVLDVLGPLAGN
jgi:predicted  nucleic acid-binding Zn-ribbon protein